MRILLVEPAKAPVTFGGDDFFVFEPLALEYVAAGVGGDHDVRILDLRLDGNLTRTLEEFRPHVVGITAYTVHVNTVRRLFEDVRRWNPEVLTVVGGHHATVAPEDFLSPSIDLVVVGEGVEPFRQIVRRFEAGADLGGIPGTARRDGRELTLTSPELRVDLDALPHPARCLTAEHRRHYYCDWMKPLASIRTSKGCPFRCDFCVLWKLTEGRYLKRRPERIVEELAGIDEDWVFFADDESLVDAGRMRTLAELIGQSGIEKRYFLYGRSDTIARNPGLLEAWRDVGLERVFVGLESFRDEDLDYISKGSRVSHNDAAIEILHQLGVEVHASLIVRPEYTRDEFARLRDYCRRLDLNYAGFAVLTPLPGTELYRRTRDQLIVDDYDYFDFIHTVLPTALPLEDFYREYRDLYWKAIPPSKGFGLLRKHRWTEIPAVLLRSRRLFRRLKTIHLDYEGRRGASGGR